MATIQVRKGRDGKPRFKVQIRVKGAGYTSKTFERKTDAVLWGRQTEADIRAGRNLPQPEAQRHTLGEAIERYKADVFPRKPKAVPQQGPQLDWWDKQIGTLSLADVTPAVLVECRSKLLKRIAPGTTNRYMAVMSHLFTVAVKEWQWVEDTPFRKLSNLPEPRGRVRFLSDDERTALLQACQKNSNPHLYDVVVIALSTGMRKQEILDLRWPDVDLQRGQLMLFDTKNRTPRAVPLAGHALDRMRDRSRIRRIDTDYVFPYPHSPKPADIDRDFARARDEAGLKDFRFHDLRHSAASYLAMNGATLGEIAAVLGHKTLQMVMRYSHLSDAHTQGVVSRMNEKIFNDDKEVESDVE
jgi:integrase